MILRALSLRLKILEGQPTQLIQKGCPPRNLNPYTLSAQEMLDNFYLELKLGNYTLQPANQGRN